MPSLELLVFVGAPLVFSNEVFAVDNPLIGTAEEINCLGMVNEARSDADFVGFKAPVTGLLPFKEDASTNVTEVSIAAFWTAVCQGMVAQTSENSGTTPAVYFGSTSKPDCKAAVSHWKAGIRHFLQLPPPFKGEKPYTTSQAVSFVALYNPQPNPTLECGLVTCQENNNPDPPPAEENQTRRLAAKAAPTFGIYCLTAPNALSTENPPFTKEQWEKIRKANAAHAAAPAVSVFVLAVLGLLVLS